MVFGPKRTAPPLTHAPRDLVFSFFLGQLLQVFHCLGVPPAVAHCGKIVIHPLSHHRCLDLCQTLWFELLSGLIIVVNAVILGINWWVLTRTVTTELSCAVTHSVTGGWLETFLAAPQHPLVARTD